MILDNIYYLAQNIRLNMDVLKFSAVFPEINLTLGKIDEKAEGEHLYKGKVFGSHQIIEQDNSNANYFFTFESGLLKLYELNAQFEYKEQNYNKISEMFNHISLVLNKVYENEKIIHTNTEYQDFKNKELPTDGYPCDRYVIGATSEWGIDREKVNLSYSLMSTGFLFFQLRAIII